MKDTECPYCGNGVDINHDDGYGIIEGRTYNQECPECGKTFVYTTDYSIYYTTSKADCLNGGEHDFEMIIIYPRHRTRMKCRHCGEERALTPEERQRFGI